MQLISQGLSIDTTYNIFIWEIPEPKEVENWEKQLLKKF